MQTITSVTPDGQGTAASNVRAVKRHILARCRIVIRYESVQEHDRVGVVLDDCKVI